MLSAFQVKPQDRVRLAQRKARIEKRLDPSWQVEMGAPMLSGTNTRYEVAARVQAWPLSGSMQLTSRT